MPDWIGESIFLIVIFFLGYAWGRINKKGVRVMTDDLISRQAAIEALENTKEAAR